MTDRPLGKRARRHISAPNGKHTRSRPYRSGEPLSGLALDATIRSALLHRSAADVGRSLSVGMNDLRKKHTVAPAQMVVVIVVDASDSMGQGVLTRMRAAKGAALALLAKAHVRRYRVGVVAFHDRRASVVLPPTRSLSLARDRLKALPTGGATPLADGLSEGWRMVRQQRIRDPRMRHLLILISDGEANVAMHDGSKTNTASELQRLAHQMVADAIDSVLIDTRPRRHGKGPMAALAQWLGGDYHHIDRLRARHVVRVVAKS